MPIPEIPVNCLVFDGHTLVLYFPGAVLISNGAGMTMH